MATEAPLQNGYFRAVFFISSFITKDFSFDRVDQFWHKEIQSVDIRHFQASLTSILQADSVVEFILTQHFIFEQKNERQNSNRDQ